MHMYVFIKTKYVSPQTHTLKNLIKERKRFSQPSPRTVNPCTRIHFLLNLKVKCKIRKFLFIQKNTTAL